MSGKNEYKWFQESEDGAQGGLGGQRLGEEVRHPPLGGRENGVTRLFEDGLRIRCTC